MAYLIGYIKDNKDFQGEKICQKSIRTRLDIGWELTGKSFDKVIELARSMGFDILHPMDKYNPEYKDFTFVFYTSLNREGNGRTGSSLHMTQTRRI